MKVYKVSVTESELKLFSEFLEKKKEGKKKKDSILKRGDRLSVKMYKNLYTSKARKANIEALDENSRDYKPLAKRRAKIVSIAVPTLATGAVVATSKLLGEEPIGALKEVALPIMAAAPVAGLTSYIDTRIKGKIVNKARDNNKAYDRAWQKNSDLIKVADGQMSEEEFAKKYYKKKEKEK